VLSLGRELSPPAAIFENAFSALENDLLRRFGSVTRCTGTGFSKYEGWRQQDISVVLFAEFPERNELPAYIRLVRIAGPFQCGKQFSSGVPL
jgi:hypothetical protein